MSDLPDVICIEIENVEEVLGYLEQTWKREQKTVIELAAVGTFLHNFYNGIENILKQVYTMRNITVPKTDTWHKDLLNEGVQNRIISKEMIGILYEYLTFRHYFVHGYGFMLDEEKLKELVENVATVWKKFLKEINNIVLADEASSQ